MWTYWWSDEYKKRHLEFDQKHQAALQYVWKKLRTVKRSLDFGGKVSGLRFNFLHPEGGGVFAVSSSGKGMRVARLYLCFDEAERLLRLLTLGDKNTQADDIRYSRQWVVDNLRKKQDDTS